MTDDLDRIAVEVAELAKRVRELENLEAPMQSRAVAELRHLQEAVTRINERGALATQGEIRLIKQAQRQLSKQVEDLEDDMKTKADAVALKELADDRKALVRIALAAVVAALLSLAVSLILRAVAG